MEILTNKTLYACGHCGKRFQIKSACLYHEEHKCNKNPNNQHVCFEMCKHLERVDSNEAAYYYDGSEWTFNFKTFRCKKHDQEMYSFKLSERRLLRRFIGGVRMPLDCSDYEVEIPDYE